MKRKEFCEKTGASSRQIDLWYRAGMDLINQEVSGSGTYRDYKESAVPAVALLAKVQLSMGIQIPMGVMKEIFVNYELGRIPIGDGLYLTWEVPNVRTDASPERGAGFTRQWKNPLRRRRKR